MTCLTILLLSRSEWPAVLTPTMWSWNFPGMMTSLKEIETPVVVLKY